MAVNNPTYSIVIPVYNRPQEVDELLNSLCNQSYANFEVIIVEDGSSETSEAVVHRYADRLLIHYFFKSNSGPGPSRNLGFEKAKGNYFVIFDSDCIVPPHYMQAVKDFLHATKIDVWGGPDRGHEDFTVLQQAMAYTMSSFFTTGGIRGGKMVVGNYQPRSFNMGMSRESFLKTNGFQFDRFAEDIELSIRMKKLGLAIAFIPDAYVFHKRRATLKQFFWQVYNFGKGRALVGRVHSGEAKLVHWFPTVFLIGLIALPFTAIIQWRIAILVGIGYLAYSLLVSLDCFFKTKKTSVALLSIPSLFTQLTGYGLGFLLERLKFLQGKI